MAKTTQAERYLLPKFKNYIIPAIAQYFVPPNVYIFRDLSGYYATPQGYKILDKQFWRDFCPQSWNGDGSDFTKIFAPEIHRALEAYPVSGDFYHYLDPVTFSWTPLPPGTLSDARKDAFFFLLLRAQFPAIITVGKLSYTGDGSIRPICFAETANWLKSRGREPLVWQSTVGRPKK